MSTQRYAVEISRSGPQARFELAGPTRDLMAGLAAAGLPKPAAAKAVVCGMHGVQVAWIGPRRMVVTASPEQAGSLRVSLAKAFSALASAIAVDVTGSTVTFELSGKGVADVLAQGIAHPVAGEAFAHGTVLATEAWGVGVLLEHSSSPERAIRLTTEASFAGYIEGWLRTAAGSTATSMAGTMRAAPPAISS